MTTTKSISLFDDIFKLQNAAPELEIDPEDPEDGFKSGLTEVGVEETECFGSSTLRKKAAIIPDDPRYKGKKTARKELYLDDEEQQDHETSSEDKDWDEDTEEENESQDDDEAEEDDEVEEDETASDNEEDLSDEDMEIESKDKEDVMTMAPSASDDREKGKAVTHQLAVWDNVIKCRISLQKVVSSCNRLPNCITWEKFAANEDFHNLAANVHSSVRKTLSSLLDLQDLLQHRNSLKKIRSRTQEADDWDKEMISQSKADGEDIEESDAVDQEDDNLSEDSDENIEFEEMSKTHHAVETQDIERKKSTLKRKLNVENVEEILSKRHSDFQTYRNDTLAKWDEKTRLSHAKIKSKNFAAFDLSVLKQIQQVLANRSHLIQRIHQNRSSNRVLGQLENDDQSQPSQETVVDDDDDEVELRQKSKQEMPLDYEIIDDSDFYHTCLRDLIELKQNEESDSTLVSKHWLEIQRLRNKHKRKVDTRASKGRKIRYNVKDKLKNYMAPYDKSFWSEEQREDLFKALFGGRDRLEETNDCHQDTGTSQEPFTIKLGI